MWNGDPSIPAPRNPKPGPHPVCNGCSAELDTTGTVIFDYPKLWCPDCFAKYQHEGISPRYIKRRKEKRKMEKSEQLLGLPPQVDYICPEIELAQQMTRMAIQVLQDNTRRMAEFREAFAALRRWGSAWKEKAELLLNCHHPGLQFTGEPDYWHDKANPVPAVNLVMPDVCVKPDQPPDASEEPEEKLE